VITTWVEGLIRRQTGRLLATAVGVAVAVALLASLGVFLAASRGSMTARAVRAVAVDWQVQVAPGADPGAVLGLVRATSGVRVAVPVRYAQVDGLSATAGGTIQTTGAGVVLGLPAGYRADFPGEIRPLAGVGDGMVLAQQTAANLHATPGDLVQVARAGLAPVPVRVAGVVDLPQANSLFQHVGAPPSAQPPAPPDNVVLLPDAQWHALFDPLAASRPDLVTTQIHASRIRALPADPAAAYTQVTAAAHHLEARSAGSAVVANNLGTTLDAARSDAAYAQVLFVFLGLPGAVLAGLLTGAVTAAGAARRRQDQALLRTRGATSRQLIGLAAAEAGLIGVAGAALGLGTAVLVGQVAFESVSFGPSASASLAWVLGSAGVGLVIAVASVLAPAYRDLCHTTVIRARLPVGRQRDPWWARYGLDMLLLCGAGAVIWSVRRNGYQLVLAPEGIPSISVSYWAFAGPALLWAGTGLLAWRLAELLLGRGRWLVGRGLRPLTGQLSDTAAAMLARRRRPLARSMALLGLALAFAASTATFNATYRAQAKVDAQLTNGADVTVTEPPATTVGPAGAAPITAIAGVRAVEPLQHRFAYIGPDLQDLYGIRPATLTRATALPDTYFQGGNARALMDQLAARPDSILISAETVQDYQLHLGDLLKLRLHDSRSGQLITVSFHYIGIVTEFPTAPNDSFLVANASYLAQQTSSDAVGAFLVDTGGQDTTAIAARIQTLVGTSAIVSDIAHTRSAIGSSLTAVDLAGLTRVELAFAFVLAAAAGGLVLALGLTERRRTFAITTALGATPRQLRGLVAAETAALAVGGLAAGAAIGWALSEVLAVVLSGVFDPPPDALTVPWSYLTAVAVTTVAALTAAAGLAIRLSRRSPISVLRQH